MDEADRWLGGRLDGIRGFIATLYAGQLHAKGVDSLVGATLGVMTGASLAVAVIGQALAQARGLVTKHAIKQVDRLLSNQGIDVWDSFAHWVPHMIDVRKKIVVAMHWTAFDRDGQSTLALHMVSRHGRATPLLWVTAWKEELTERRNDFEDTCLRRLKALLPAGCEVTVLADGGFGDHKLFNYIDELGSSYVIRIRGNIYVTDATGETRPAAGWVGKGGRARKLAGARVTASHGFPVGAVVCVHAKGMKEPWCLAASDGAASATRIGKPTRRDWLLLVNAFAIALLAMLGAACEALGMDRLLKSNTSKTHTHSLFRQGCMLYELIPTMPDTRLVPLMARFAESVAQCSSFSGLLEVV